MKYKYIGAYPDSLENGPPLSPGDFVELNSSDFESAYNRDMLESGKLLQLEDEEPQEAKEPQGKGSAENDEPPAKQRAGRKAAATKKEE